MALLDLLRDQNKDPDASPMAPAGMLPLQGGASLGGLPPLAGGSVLKPLIPGGALPRDNSAYAHAIAPGLNTPGLGPGPSVSDAISPLPLTLKPLVKPALTPRQTRENFLESDIFHRENPAKPHGFWQNLRHVAAVAGNVAGGLFAPAAMAMIPGTYINNQLTLNREQGELAGDQAQDLKFTSDQAENAHKTAETRLLNAQAEGLENPAVKPKEELWKELPGYTGPNGEPLEIEQNSGQTRPIQGAKAAPSKAAGEQPLGNVDNLNATLQDRFQVLNPGQPLPKQYTLPPNATQKDYDRVDKALESFERATGTKAQRDQANALRQQAAEMARERLNNSEDKAGKPTADEQRRADLSENLNENLNALEAIIDRRPELFGKYAGHWTELRAKFGTDDPDIAQLMTIEHQLGMAQISAHGMRSAQGIQAAADSIMNGLHNSAGALKASIAAARNSVKTFQGDVDRATGKNAGTTPAGGAAAKPAAVFNPKDPLGVL